MKALTGILLAAFAASAANAITIGPGPVIGTNRSVGVTGSFEWHEEFQDWTAADLRALDPRDACDGDADLVALYAHEDASNVFFRVDLFDLRGRAKQSLLLLLDLAPGGNPAVPGLDVHTDHPWELAIQLGPNNGEFVRESPGRQPDPADWLGSYRNAQLDSVEFGVTRRMLIRNGWDGQSAFALQAISMNGSSALDAVGGELAGREVRGAVSSRARTGRAAYAAIAHANQSIGGKSALQGHLFNGASPLKPGFVRLLESADMLNAPVNLHLSGTLLMSLQWAAQDPKSPDFPDRDGPTFIRRVKDFVTAGPGSLIGGVLAEHIFPYFEGQVNRESLRQNAELLRSIFGAAADVPILHIPERVMQSDTNNAHVSALGPMKGRPFEDILAAGYQATYLDEVTHLHWWFHPDEQKQWTNDCACAGWAGFGGCEDEPYHHKIHRINGVDCFMINDREDQQKFGPDDGGMQLATRESLLAKAMDPDQRQVAIVFDDWEAYAGNSFASSTPNNNADQWDRTLRWAANHPWIEIVSLRDILARARVEPGWIIDHGGRFDLPTQTYEWLKRACEGSYDNWYFGSDLEQSFAAHVPTVHDAWSPPGMKPNGDINTTNTLIRDTWDRISGIKSRNLGELARWSYSAMIYETAWHDEDASADRYQSRNYQVSFDRSDACADARADTTFDSLSGWGLRLQSHVRDLGVLVAASEWVESVRSGAQGPGTLRFAADLDDDRVNEYVLCNDRVFLCFEAWGARLVKAFAMVGDDAVEVVGAPAANPSRESENEEMDRGRCSAFKDRYAAGPDDGRYVDQMFLAAGGDGEWTFTSADGHVAKKVSLPRGADVAVCEYAMSAIDAMYARFGLGPNQMDMMLNGSANISEVAGDGYRGLRNRSGGEVFVVPGEHCELMDGVLPGAGWDGRELPFVQQFETKSLAPAWSVALAFSEKSAQETVRHFKNRASAAASSLP